MAKDKDGIVIDENREKIPCTDCGKSVTRDTPSLGYYCDKCWMEHIMVVPRMPC